MPHRSLERQNSPTLWRSENYRDSRLQQGTGELRSTSKMEARQNGWPAKMQFASPANGLNCSNGGCQLLAQRDQLPAGYESVLDSGIDTSTEGVKIRLSRIADALCGRVDRTGGRQPELIFDPMISEPPISTARPGKHCKTRLPRRSSAKIPATAIRQAIAASARHKCRGELSLHQDDKLPHLTMHSLPASNG